MPAQSLFDRVERDLSHGSVRLDELMKLAQYVLCATKLSGN